MQAPVETAPSPFIEGTKIQFAWDSTSLGAFKVCPRYYQYTIIEGWRLRHESVHLTFGIHYHTALETYDKLRALGDTHEDALRSVVLKALCDTWEWNPDHPSKTREGLIRSVIWYLDHFGEADPAQTIILANGKPAVELSFRHELDYGPVTAAKPYVLCGHLDRVVNFADGTYVMDRKTSGSTLSSTYFDQFAPDNQMSLYTLAAKVVYQTPVRGVIIDAAQIAVGFTRFARGFTNRTEAQLEEWLGNTKTWLFQAETYAVAEFWPMNDRSCSMYGGCVFRRVCSKSPEIREKFLESDFVRKPWNPLQTR